MSYQLTRSLRRPFFFFLKKKEIEDFAHQFLIATGMVPVTVQLSDPGSDVNPSRGGEEARDIRDGGDDETH